MPALETLEFISPWIHAPLDSPLDHWDLTCESVWLPNKLLLSHANDARLERDHWLVPPKLFALSVKTCSESGLS